MHLLFRALLNMNREIPTIYRSVSLYSSIPLKKMISASPLIIQLPHFTLSPASDHSFSSATFPASSPPSHVPSTSTPSPASRTPHPTSHYPNHTPNQQSLVPPTPTPTTSISFSRGGCQTRLLLCPGSDTRAPRIKRGNTQEPLVKVIFFFPASPYGAGGCKVIY